MYLDLKEYLSRDLHMPQIVVEEEGLVPEGEDGLVVEVAVARCPLGETNQVMSPVGKRPKMASRDLKNRHPLRHEAAEPIEDTVPDLFVDLELEVGSKITNPRLARRM